MGIAGEENKKQQSFSFLTLLAFSDADLNNIALKRYF